MSSGTEKIDFREFAKVIEESHPQQNVKLFCTKSSIVSLSDFYAGLQQEIGDIDSQITPCKERPSISDFANSFKAFDAYPSNLVKPRKTLKDLNKLNSTVLREGITIAENTKNDFTPTIAHEPEHWQSGSEIYQDFLKFERKLKQLVEKLQTRTLENECTIKTKFINTFAQQIEKLLHFNRVCVPAFNNQEEKQLRRIVEDINNLISLQANQDIFKDITDDGSAWIDRFESLIDVISHALVSISYFNVF